MFSFSSCLLLSLHAAEVPELNDTVLAPSLVPRQEQPLLPLGELGPSHCAKTLMTSPPSSQNCSGLPLSLLEQLKCNAMRGIFRLIIDAPAIKGRWQSAVQNAGRHQVSTQVQIHLVSYSPLPFFLLRQHISFSLCIFLVTITDLQHTFSVVHHCFQMKLGSQRPVMNLVMKLALVYLLFSALPHAGLCK